MLTSARFNNRPPSQDSCGAGAASTTRVAYQESGPPGSRAWTRYTDGKQRNGLAARTYSKRPVGDAFFLFKRGSKATHRCRKNRHCSGKSTFRVANPANSSTDWCYTNLIRLIIKRPAPGAYSTPRSTPVKNPHTHLSLMFNLLRYE